MVNRKNKYQIMLVFLGLSIQQTFYFLLSSCSTNIVYQSLCSGEFRQSIQICISFQQFCLLWTSDSSKKQGQSQGIIFFILLLLSYLVLCFWLMPQTISMEFLSEIYLEIIIILFTVKVLGNENLIVHYLLMLTFKTTSIVYALLQRKAYSQGVYLWFRNFQVHFSFCTSIYYSLDSSQKTPLIYHKFFHLRQQEGRVELESYHLIEKNSCNIKITRIRVQKINAIFQIIKIQAGHQILRKDGMLNLLCIDGRWIINLQHKLQIFIHSQLQLAPDPILVVVDSLHQFHSKEESECYCFFEFYDLAQRSKIACLAHSYSSTLLSVNYIHLCQSLLCIEVCQFQIFLTEIQNSIPLILLNSYNMYVQS